jgi:hypothetical protein
MQTATSCRPNTKVERRDEQNLPPDLEGRTTGRQNDY